MITTKKDEMNLLDNNQKKKSKKNKKPVKRRVKKNKTKTRSKYYYSKDKKFLIFSGLFFVLYLFGMFYSMTYLPEVRPHGIFVDLAKHAKNLKPWSRLKNMKPFRHLHQVKTKNDATNTLHQIKARREAERKEKGQETIKGQEQGKGQGQRQDQEQGKGQDQRQEQKQGQEQEQEQEQVQKEKEELPNESRQHFDPQITLDQIDVPVGVWPVPPLCTETFEEIIHPANENIKMSVPKFWSSPVHNNKLMPRELAMKIGTCIKPDDSGSFTSGDYCHIDDRTIFVAIASYRDYQCRQTVDSIFTHAKFPQRIRVSVIDQIEDGVDVKCDEPQKPCEQDPDQMLCLYKNQINVYTMKAEDSVGPVFARHLGSRAYRGEYYATQSDAHVTYATDWDVDIILQMEATHNDMAVLSTYLSDVKGSIDLNTGRSTRNSRPIMCNTDYEGEGVKRHLRHLSQPEREPDVRGTPELQPYWAAGYSFSRGHFIVNVPYDLLQPMVFQGEEMSIGIRGFTMGYDLYAPERSVCFHHYAVLHPERKKVKTFWEHANTYAGVEKKSMKRLLGIVHMNPEIPREEWDHTDEVFYGIGNVRTPELFYDVFGIDVIHKTVEHHLCRFVDAGMKINMHREFTPKLRSDGMGIDYSKIKYRFKDPMPGQKQ